MSNNNNFFLISLCQPFRKKMPTTIDDMTSGFPFPTPDVKEWIFFVCNQGKINMGKMGFVFFNVPSSITWMQTTTFSNQFTGHPRYFSNQGRKTQRRCLQRSLHRTYHHQLGSFDTTGWIACQSFALFDPTFCQLSKERRVE